MIFEKFNNLLLKGEKFKNRIIVLLFILFPGSLFAQTTSTESSNQTFILYTIGFLFLLILISFISLFYFGFGEEEEGKKREASTVTVWAKIKNHLVSAAPIEKEGEILLEDDYDGIKELDNKVPPWFNYLFYTTIIFAVIYFLNYQVFKTGMSQAQEYQAEMQAAAVQQAELTKKGTVISAENVKLLEDRASLNAGKEVFKANCVPCHGPEGGGVVGPNLTDDYWIHGGGIKNVFHTIKNGVPSKGMPTWMNQLSMKQIQDVASYVISLHGTHPANAKPPQGEKYEANGD